MTERMDPIGWHGGARHRISPNHNARPPGCEPELIVVHNISLPPGEFGTGAAEALFCNTLDCRAHPFFEQLDGLRVSAHFLIDRSGCLTQFVPCDMRAWHAGVSSWAGRAGCNDFSIGIELEGTDTQPYEDAQYAALVALIEDLRGHYAGLRSGGIVGHSDIAPGRKTDPGPAFSWGRLRELLRPRSSPSG